MSKTDDKTTGQPRSLDGLVGCDHSELRKQLLLREEELKAELATTDNGIKQWDIAAQRKAIDRLIENLAPNGVIDGQ